MEASRSTRPAPGVALVIPTFNEVESIGAVVRAVSRETIDEIIVADGGSTDGTTEAAVQAGARVVDAGRGYGRACLLGAEATKAGIVAYMDGDGADDPAALTSLLAPIRAGACDFTIASRTRGEREPGSMAAHQVLAGTVAGGLIGLLYGVRYTDMCALRAIRRDRLMALGMRELGYGWNLEMQMRAARAGLRIAEIPVSYRCRIGGESKVAGSLFGTLRAGSRIVATFARVALERAPKSIGTGAAGPAAAGVASPQRGPRS
ncbi:MAG: glycosyltransferase family 2 protein [Rhodoplanes sp.]|uniref:glycosyltransferase family 2 protein n=1 Tax=Rhodoplanes sp. TaxID=1968906 RepID=UPI0017D2CC3B|nr:glycosyltransferase family 2 protein [Rhodoplanes sp.]NVO17033.1 glycosyltransferase family 2 protein [Rhodoplanes sp.]